LKSLSTKCAVTIVKDALQIEAGSHTILKGDGLSFEVHEILEKQSRLMSILSID